MYCPGTAPLSSNGLHGFLQTAERVPDGHWSRADLARMAEKGQSEESWNRLRRESLARLSAFQDAVRDGIPDAVSMLLPNCKVAASGTDISNSQVGFDIHGIPKPGAHRLLYGASKVSV